VLVPNKTISLNDSCLYKAAKLLSKIDCDIPIAGLYAAEKKEFANLADFIDALDLLFVLGKVLIDQEHRVIKIA